MLHMKKNILIDATGGGSWIGGLYYKKNIAFMLSNNENITKRHRIIVVTDTKNKELFYDLKNITIVTHNSISGIKKHMILIWICLKNKCKYLYTYPGHELSKIWAYEVFGIKPIGWIADFQHKYFSSFFTDNENSIRDRLYSEYAYSNKGLVLSSNSALDDFNTFYHPRNKHVYIVHFVSYIQKEMQRIDSTREQNILKKYGIDGIKYACVMNQFWQHKNHLVLLKAIKEQTKNNPNNKLKIVLTGKLEDYRVPDYISTIKALFEDQEIKKRCILLGFIDREEQIAIMKNAAFVIQPSLFEGWGTVVEDAKVLDKTILLSDIPVHREQMNEKCILFDPHDPVALAELIEQESKKEHHDDVEKGIADMYMRAKEYSKGFERLLKDLETKK